MLILCDRRIPAQARFTLSGLGQVVEFSTENITYNAISGHPDIFFCPTPAGLIVAPNLPETYFQILGCNAIRYSIGSMPVGKVYPETARYNALVNERFIIQNPGTSDPVILNLNPEKQIIAVKQGYVKCSLVALPNNSFITSDRGIEKSLKKQNAEVLFVDPAAIWLDDFEHGFFGGVCGMIENKLFVCGSLSYFKEKNFIEEFTSNAGVEIVELYQGQPMDIGTLIFLHQQEGLLCTHKFLNEER